LRATRFVGRFDQPDVLFDELNAKLDRRALRRAQRRLERVGGPHGFGVSDDAAAGR
jgi:hypothetical protein